MLRLFILLLYVFVAALMIAVILFQKTEAGMGMGSASGNFATARGTGNLLTRLTGALATIFMLMSLWLAYLAKREVVTTKVVFDVASEMTETPLKAPAGDRQDEPQPQN